MWSANGHQATFPIAREQIEVDGEIYNVEAAVALHLPEDVLLGVDVPLTKHIARRLREDNKKELLAELQVQCQEEHQAWVVTTRSQDRMKVSKEVKPNGLEST